jgi:hypothetical protein
MIHKILLRKQIEEHELYKKKKNKKKTKKKKKTKTKPEVNSDTPQG